MAQVRAHADPVPATARLVRGEVDGEPARELVVRLREPLSGVAPGQTLVIYQGTRVLGQATIHRAYSLDRPDISV